MSHTNLVLGSNWQDGEWPERVAVSHVGGSERQYVPERVSRKVPGRMKYGRRMPMCSECGYSLGDVRWKHCPGCGGKVEGEHYL